MTDNRTCTATPPSRHTTALQSSEPVRILLLAAASTFVMWRHRARSRAHLRDLEVHLLDDIGMSPGQRDHEARKPFWVR